MLEQSYLMNLKSKSKKIYSSSSFIKNKQSLAYLMKQIYIYFFKSAFLKKCFKENEQKMKVPQKLGKKKDIQFLKEI